MRERGGARREGEERQKTGCKRGTAESIRWRARDAVVWDVFSQHVRGAGFFVMQICQWGVLLCGSLSFVDGRRKQCGQEEVDGHGG